MEKLNAVVEKREPEKELKRFKGYVLGMQKLLKKNAEKKEGK